MTSVLGSTLTEVHGNWAWVVIGANATVGFWALGAHVWAGLRHRALWWSTGAAEATVFVQAGLGAAIVNVDGIEVDDFHMLYGASAIVAVGILYSYRDQLREHLYLLYGFGGLFIMGLGIRAMVI